MKKGRGHLTGTFLFQLPLPSSPVFHYKLMGFSYPITSYYSKRNFPTPIFSGQLWTVKNLEKFAWVRSLIKFVRYHVFYLFNYEIIPPAKLTIPPIKFSLPIMSLTNHSLSSYHFSISHENFSHVALITRHEIR